MAEMNPPPRGSEAHQAHGGETGTAPPPARFRPAWQGRQAYAAIDLGTNNCRLLIARPSGENFTVMMPSAAS